MNTKTAGAENSSVPNWTNEETALAWAHHGDEVAAMMGCHPENPPESIDLLDAQGLFGCDVTLRHRELTDDFILLCIQRVDWQQIADHLNRLARPADATGPLHDHYIVAYGDESYAFAAGQYPVDALLNVRENPSSPRLGAMWEIEAAIKRGVELIVLPATEELAEAVRDGGCSGWSYLDGVACTYDEIKDRLNE